MGQKEYKLDVNENASIQHWGIGSINLLQEMLQEVAKRYNKKLGTSAVSLAFNEDEAVVDLSGPKKHAETVEGYVNDLLSFIYENMECDDYKQAKEYSEARKAIIKHLDTELPYRNKSPKLGQTPENDNGQDKKPASGTNQNLSSEFKAISTPLKTVIPGTENHDAFVRAMDDDNNTCIFGVGPAGTGKTYLAVAKAIEELNDPDSDCTQVMFIRPIRTANGEEIGILKGTLTEKTDSYMIPFYDKAVTFVGEQGMEDYYASGKFRNQFFGFMRGESLDYTIVILDEGQNATPEQMEMLLTRIGKGTKLFVTGCLSSAQNDLGGAEANTGLADAIDVMGDDEAVYCQYFTQEDNMRSGFSRRVVEKYEKRREQAAQNNGPS